jgi:hypothetical protein
MQYLVDFLHSSRGRDDSSTHHHQAVITELELADFSLYNPPMAVFEYLARLHRQPNDFVGNCV